MAPLRVAAPMRRLIGDERLLFHVTLAAILSQVLISTHLLAVIGIPSGERGGLIRVKFHVGAGLALLAVLLATRRRAPVLANLFGPIAITTLFPLAAATMLLGGVDAMLMAGTSGGGAMENGISAAFLGFAMERVDAVDRRRIARVLVASFTLNALCDDPRTGAIMTMMGALLCLATDLSPRFKAVTLGILLVGLLPSGGGSGAMLDGPVVLDLDPAGRIVWDAGLALILYRLWREGGLLPRVILLAIVAVVFGDNALASDSTILFVGVAAVMSAAAFATPPVSTIRLRAIVPPPVSPR